MTQVHKGRKLSFSIGENGVFAALYSFYKYFAEYWKIISSQKQIQVP